MLYLITPWVTTEEGDRHIRITLTYHRFQRVTVKGRVNIQVYPFKLLRRLSKGGTTFTITHKTLPT
jgi:hypothetical protein